VSGWSARRVAEEAGAELLGGFPDADSPAPAGDGPPAVTLDSRRVAGGELFVGLAGERDDGGSFARSALDAGAWGALVAPEHARPLLGAGSCPAGGGVVLAHPDPLRGLQALARAWRHELGSRGARVVAITGSTGKTSTKDILAGLIGGRVRTAATPANLNTEIGLPLAILAAPADTECLVLEMAMRGPGQIAELTAIAEPDVGVIVNVGPSHLELLGSLEAIAAAKAELIDGLAPGSVAVVPAAEPLLARHLRGDVRTITFGEGGDVALAELHRDGSVTIAAGGDRIELWPSFSQAHNLRNLLAAVAVARALEIEVGGRLEVSFSAMRGERVELPGGVVVIDDCYNANPMSMAAAIDDLAETAPGRRVAVLGEMLELGPESPRMHREVGFHAAERGVTLLLAVGPLAAETAEAFTGEAHWVADADAAAALLPTLLIDGDTVLVKASRGVGLERVLPAVASRSPGARPSREALQAAPGAGPGRL